jgi:hypothetical protein
MKLVAGLLLAFAGMIAGREPPLLPKQFVATYTKYS